MKLNERQHTINHYRDKMQSVVVARICSYAKLTPQSVALRTADKFSPTRINKQINNELLEPQLCATAG